VVKTTETVSLVIPAYNEAARIGASIAKLKKFLDGQPYKFEVIIVVEKSADKTAEKTRAAVGRDRRFKIIANPVHRGKGYAVRCGISHAAGDYIFFLDSDLSTDLSAFSEFMAFFHAHQDVDLLIGSRAHKKSQVLVHQNALRQWLGGCFNLAVRTLTMRELKDTQCGFKAFRKPAAKDIFKSQVLDGFAFDVEVLLIARAKGYKAAALPVIWANSGGSTVNFDASFQMLKDLIGLKRHRPELKKPHKSSSVFLLETDG